MISFVRGFLVEQYDDSIVVDVNGLGYEVIIPPRNMAKLPARGEIVLLYTYLQVLENEFRLYGFMEKEELKLFKQLLRVSGMGAKGAVNILDFIDPHGFYQAIVSQDEKLLIKIPGVGKKTASRLIFELKDKISTEQLTVVPDQHDSSVDDVLEALEVLGYGRSEIYPLVLEMQSRGELDGSVEENLKKILKARNVQMKK
ncbi:MAG TPA: Holliday junction branch migration protein RuvA [Gelria sp.]|nr:Holliday junction branch migration protein RuvA [Gelria sp.]